MGRRSFQHEVYPKFDEYRYQNKLLFTMEYDFECKRGYPDILEDKYCNF